MTFSLHKSNIFFLLVHNNRWMFCMHCWLQFRLNNIYRMVYNNIKSCSAKHIFWDAPTCCITDCSTPPSSTDLKPQITLCSWLFDRWLTLKTLPTVTLWGRHRPSVLVLKYICEVWIILPHIFVTSKILLSCVSWCYGWCLETDLRMIQEFELRTWPRVLPTINNSLVFIFWSE